MKTKSCELGKTQFVDEKTVSKILFTNDYWKTHKKETKIKENEYQCEGGKEMKGDIYGIK